jgi:hypothetical protein
MFDAIKRLLGLQPAETMPPRQRRRKKKVDHNLSGPTPLPDIVEGNDETDWDLWQDSVDSQMQSLNSRSSPLRRTDGKSTGATGYDELDPFSSVHKNRG